MRKLLLDLGTLNVVEEKTRLPANYAALGVEDVSSAKATGTEVDVIAPGHTWVLVLGKPSGAKSGYVRVASSAQSLLAAPLITADAAPKSWLDNALLDLPAERVREIQERPADGAGFVAVRQKKEDAHFNIVPVPKGRELSSLGAADTLGCGAERAHAGGRRQGAGAADPQEPARLLPHLRRPGGRGDRAQRRHTCPARSERTRQHPRCGPRSAAAQHPLQRLGV